MGKAQKIGSADSSSLEIGGNGKPSMSVPTASGIVARLTNGLSGNVSAMTGNFKLELAQVSSNLPQTPDPTKATGFDQVQLLAYAACSDLTTGTTPKMQSIYGVNPATSIAANQANLIKAGVTILDNYVAGLASKGPTASNVTTALTNIVNQISAVSGNTSKVAFMSVCIAANTAGTTLMSF
jgi:hypothetical protein